MADQDQNVDQNTPTEDTKTPEYTEIEQQAIEQGWRPKDEYNGDPHKWVSADIFVARAPLFEHIEAQKKELKKLREGLTVMASHNAKVEEAGYKRAMAELRQLKKEALLENDADAVIDIDDKIDAMRAQQTHSVNTKVAEAMKESEVINPEFSSWVNRNNWYVNDIVMKAAADALGAKLASEGMTPSAVLSEVEKTIRKRFPDSFENPNRAKASAVEAPRGKGAAPVGKQKYDLTDDERTAMRAIVRTGIITEEKYIADLKKIKEAN